MGKKKYTTEITDVFESKLDAKQALKLAKNIKLSQEKAFPSTNYKTQLKERLKNIYIIDQEKEVSPRFSIFQIFGAFASFIFIGGTILMVLELRHESEMSMQITPVQENSIIQKITDTQEDMEVVDEHYEVEVQQKEQTIESGEEMLPLFPPKEKELKIERGQGEDFINEKILPAQSMMMDSMMGIVEEEIQSFSDICFEYDGVISEDGVYCMFADGKQCEEYNIYECAGEVTNIQRDKTIEIDLEELMQEYGQ